jgi:tungstate transport system ATP-binding protein
MCSNQPPLLTIDNLLVNRGEGFSLSIDHFDIQAGEVLAIIGPNGAGKSTLLLAISRLLEPEAGSIHFRGQAIEEINKLHYRRQIALVLQEPLLLSTSVFNNIATGLRFRGISKSDQSQFIERWLSRLSIERLKNHPASQLSGGQAQRVSLARALVLKPDLLLMDEPFRALDAPSRTSLLQDLRNLLSETGTTTIFVTHDQEQALFLGDRVAVMLEGKLRQIGLPQTVYSSPVDTEVADFLGVENVLPGQVINNGNGRLTVQVKGNHLEAIGGMESGREVLFCLRPEDITLWKTLDIPTSSARNKLTGHIISITTRGPLLQVKIDCGFPLVVLITRASAQELEIEPGEEISASFKASAVHLIPR